MTEFKINGTLNATKGAKIKGTNYILVSAAGTDIQNAAELQAAYTAAVAMTPSSTNIITIVASPGYYNFNAADFVMTTPYINLVSLDGNRSIIFNGTYTIRVDENDIYVNGVDTLGLPFKIDSDMRVTIENCKGGNNSFGYAIANESNVEVPGTFINCTGGNDSFGGTDQSQNPEGDLYTSRAGGIFINCTGGDRCFGGGGGTLSGTCTNCIGSDGSFGGQGAFQNGTLSGRLYYCRLTTGTFNTIAEGAFTRLCLDGENSENNQPGK